MLGALGCDTAMGIAGVRRMMPQQIRSGAVATLLRIELERLRALENEASRTNELLVGYIDRLIDSRDEWRREAERLSALCSIQQNALDSRLVRSWAQIRKFCHCK